MAAELPRPGVEVIQQFRTVSPTIVTPTLPPCVVGVAKQLVEVLTSSGSGNSLNSDALINLPAFFIAAAAPGSPPKYAGLNALHLDFTVNNSAAIVVTFADVLAAGLTPATVVAQVNARLLVLGVTSVLAETVGTTQWRLRSVGTGTFQTIYILPATSATVLTTFVLGAGKTYAGLSYYNQYEVTIPPQNYPDPRLNMSELTIDTDTVRVFASTSGGGTSLREFTRNQAFISNGTVNDHAVLKGNVDMTGGGFLAAAAAKTLVMKVNTTTLPSFTISNPPATLPAFLAELVAGLPGITVTQETATNFLVLTAVSSGAASYLKAVSGTLLAVVGIVAAVEDYGESIEATDDGNGDAYTSLLDFYGYNFTTASAVAVLTGSAVATWPASGETVTISDGKQPQTVVFGAGIGTIGAIVTAINAIMAPAVGGKITASDAAGALRLTHSDKGDESYIEIVGGTCLDNLDPGGTPTIYAGAKVRGAVFAPLPGDELYIDGVFYGNILEVAPGGVVTRLRIDRQVPITLNVGARFYIEGKNLPVGGSATRPYPDLAVGAATGAVLKHSFIRDAYGVATAVLAPMYMQYTATRKDVSALAANAGLLRFSTTTELELALEPITMDNPLGLGLFFALLNAPGTQVTGLGVDEVSADAPYGTIEGFTRAAEYLETFEVYAIAPLTHDQTVAQVFNTHVDFMSDPSQKGERIVLWNPEVPTRALDTLVDSGSGDALTTTTFDTKAAGLATEITNAGVTPVGVIPTTDGLYLDIESDNKRYSISGVSGSVVTIRTTFTSPDNDDLFYSTTALTLPLISEAFSVKVRGDLLLTPVGTVDKAALAASIAGLGLSFLNRRFWMTFPDECAATIGGLEQLLPGFYMNAGIVGMIAQQPPQQSFTNFPMTGYTRVIGSNDTFSESQLNQMAAGGAYIIIQEGAGTPLFSRMALTTNMTSIETRTDSITKAVDFVAKFLRRSLRIFIGRFNVTHGFLDTLGSVVQGLLGFLVETGIILGGRLNNVIQDETAPDTVLIDVGIDPAYPCNFIRLTLVI